MSAVRQTPGEPETRGTGHCWMVLTKFWSQFACKPTA